MAIACLTTKQALYKLHADIASELHKHEEEEKKKGAARSWFREGPSAWIKDAYHPNSHFSMLCFISGLMLLFGAILLFASYGLKEESRDHRIVTDAVILVVTTLINFMIMGMDSRLRRREIRDKVRLILNYIEDCARICQWTPINYPQLNTPLSPCITLQWTYRDGYLVNLHWSLLVEGDLIALRPGQIVPGHCRPVELEDGQRELNFGEQFVPKSEYPQKKLFQEPRARLPLKTRKYVMLETPYIKNLRLALSQSCNRPSSVLEIERHHIYLFWLIRIFIPVIFIISFGTNLIRWMYYPNNVGHWTEMFFILQVQAVLPLLPLTYPLLWLILNIYGIARLHAVFNSFKQVKLDVDALDEYGELHPSVPSCRLTWRKVCYHFFKILVGRPTYPCRTTNLLHVLGSVTALCCVDKKGLLSWPNPTAEKVFFLRTPDTPDESDDELSIHSTNSLENEPVMMEPNCEPLPTRNVNKCKIRTERTFGRESAVEVLDLTHDNQVPFGLQFDDPNWKQYLKSLKPLGLAILLNTCNPATQDNYSQFTAHIAYEVLHNEDVVPVVNRRCLCELARQIGFTDQAMDVFQMQEQLSTFRPMTDLIRKDRFAKSFSFTKLKFPFPHMVSVIMKETTTGMLQLLSQGTGDIILDSCSDYWDGQDLCPFLESDRKKILDFYHRTSLTAYCTAFAYRPLSTSVAHNFTNLYLELPADSSSLYPLVRSPTPTKSWDLQSLDHRVKPWWTQYFSTDSLFGQEFESEPPADVETCFENQCNQVFIAMVTMQYQARMDVVHLIENLDKACIRFVHFSKENELRSRVFSEKMGLESGWNCHISLLSEKNKSESVNSCAQLINTRLSSKMMKNVSSDNLFFNLKNKNIGFSPKSRHPLANKRYFSFSAPTVINVECTQVKFGEDISLYDINQEDSVTSSMKMQSICEDNYSNGNSSTGDAQLEEPLVNNHHQGDVKTTDDSIASRSPSHVTESTDHSAPVGFDMSNRAKLPKGIENIRPHLKNIDNVPLLVSLFTDCIPQATQEMIKIMQENGEVVLCIGSVANCHNMALFLQSDASIAVEPLYPQLCMKQPVFHPPPEGNGPPPIDISHALNGLTSSLSFYREDSVSIYHLVMEARHLLICFRTCFHFMLASCLSLSVLHLLATIFFLPPPINISHVMWMVFFIFPLLSVSFMNNPISQEITTMATGKKTDITRKKTLFNFIFFIGIKFIPSMLVCIICFMLMLNEFCEKKFVKNPNECHITLGNTNFSRPYEWSGLSTDYTTTLHFSQNICASLIVFYYVLISTNFVHKYHQLYQKTLFQNWLWCIVVLIAIGFQVVYCAIDIYIENYSGTYAPGISDIAIAVWAIAFVWPVGLIIINELVKSYEIRSNVRYQKKARLQFGTKLGMNSPF